MAKPKAPKKAKKKRRQVTHTDLTLEDLQSIERKQAAREERPKTLKVEQISTAQNAFQWRDTGDRFRKIEHVKELGRVLREGRCALDPLVVMAIGERFYVIEGHHRLEAYAAQGWAKGIPVTYFPGTVEEAREEALRLNIKDKLALTRDEKSEAAWQLMKAGKRKRKEIVDITKVSPSTLKNMASAMRDRPEDAGKPWAEVRRGDRAAVRPDDDWQEQEAARLAEGIAKVVGAMLKKYPTVIARALELVDDDLPGLLISEWREMVAEQAATWEEADRDMDELL